MHIPEQIIREISERINIEDIVGNYVSLKKAGRYYKGLCPFHSEKTPSFTVTPDKGMYFCFSCKKGGNVFNFLMEVEHMTFPEAVEHLAARAGIDIEHLKSQENTESESQRKKLIDLYEKVSGSFSYILEKSSTGSSALSYLKDRGVTDESILKFRLGFAPADRYWLRKFLRNKSYSDDFLDSSGLFSRKYRDISLFSGRVIFPIFSRHNSVIAFGGRALGDNMPKYLNSPESEIFKKSSELYGFNLAMKEIRKNDFVYIVEGYMDVIAMNQGGVENVVAPLGTALTEHHASLLRKNCSRAVLLFDGDEAGLKATEKGAYICEKGKLSCDVIILPKNSDPADILKKDGAEALKKYLKYPINCFEFLIKKYLENCDTGRPDEVTALLNRLFPFIDTQDSEVNKTGRLKTVAEYLDTDYRPVYEDYRKYTVGEKRRNTGLINNENNKEISVTPELYLMLAVLDNFDYFYLVREEFEIDDILERKAKELYIILEDCYRNRSFSADHVLDMIREPDFRNFIAKKMTSEEFSVNTEQLIRDSIIIVKLKNLKLKRQSIEKQICRADADTYEIDELIAEKLYFDKEIDKLKGMNKNVRIAE